MGVPMTMTGNLPGAKYGVEAIPAHWVHQLELKEIIAEFSSDLFIFPTGHGLDE